MLERLIYKSILQFSINLMVSKLGVLTVFLFQISAFQIYLNNQQFLTMIFEKNIDRLPTGKKMIVHPTRRDEFSLGWNDKNQLNDYQAKGKNAKEITGKVTSSQHSKPTEKNPFENFEYQNHYQNQRNRNTFENYRQDTPTYENNLNTYDYQNPKQGQKNNINQQYQNFQHNHLKQQVPQSESRSERRTPIKPKDSIKDIIYNNMDVNNCDSLRPNNKVYNKLGRDNYGPIRH